MALRWADHRSREFYQLRIGLKFYKQLILNAHRPENLVINGRIYIYIYIYI
jgi:hypothetical protein